VNIHNHRVYIFLIVILMTTRNAVGFCPRCNQQVLLTRKDIDVCLAIVLLIFTLGIGLLIYLAIYYSKAEDRCVHCGAQITRYNIQSSYIPSQNQFQTSQNSIPLEESEESLVKEVKYCSFCGEKIAFLDRFCQNCGAKV